VGQTYAAAKARLDGQPLSSAVIYRPAKPGERVDMVVGQLPRRGTASAHDTVTLVLPKSLHGTVPNLVGLSLARAEQKIARLRLDVEVRGGSRGRITRQSLRPHTAVVAGMKLTLTVARAKAG
jgi:beta-lactam-binding protein with PASTA domain